MMSRDKGGEKMEGGIKRGYVVDGTEDERGEAH
jgi:hypothetical protein